MKAFRTILAAALLIAACAPDYSEQINGIEQIVSEHPREALDSIRLLEKDYPAMSAKDKAYYSLIYAMALDKSYIDTTDTSILEPALKYYSKHGTPRQKMLTYYYLANTQINANETANCLISLTDAEKYAKKIEDHFYLGMIYRMMADAYNDIYCRNEELKYRQLSYDSFKLSGSQRHIDFAFLDLGIALSNTHQYTQAIEIYKDLLIVAEDNADSILVNNCLSHLGHSYSLNGNYRESITSILKQNSLFPQRVMSKDYRNLARDYAALAMPDSAIFYMKKAENLIKNNIDTQVTYSINYELSKYTGDYKTALENYEELFDLNAYVTDSIMGKSVLVTLQDYIVQQAEYDNYVAEQKRNQLYFIISFLILSIIAASIILYLRWMNKNQEIEKNLQLAQSIRDTLKVRESQISEMTTHIDNLFSQRFKTIDELCNVYFETKDTKSEKDRIYKQVLKQINDLGNDEVQKLEEIINTYRNNLLNAFRNDFPTLNNEIYKFATYSFSGFSPRAISILMNEKIENIYNKKSRLKNRIQKSVVPRKEEYLSLMA